MEHTREHPTIIDLDDPTPRGTRVMYAIIVVLVVALLIAPFVIDDGAGNQVSGAPRTNVRAAEPEICRPSLNVPDVLDPVAGFALPSWMRICDWIIQPVITDPVAPEN